MDATPLKHRRLGVVIPAYQAERTLASVVDGLLRFLPEDRVVVVDDGSGDGTSAVAASKGVSCLRHEINRGKGAALANGLRHGHAQGWEWAVTVDADGQHAAEDLNGFLEAVPGPDTGILVGRRMRRGTDMPWHRRFSNAATTSFLSNLAGQPVYDAQSGFRAYRLDALAAYPGEGRFEWEPKVLVLCARKGLKLEAVPVHTVYTANGSHIRLAADTWRFLRMVGSLAWTV